MNNQNRTAKKVAFIGVLGALSCVLMLFRFPLPFVPGFYEFDIAELPALFAGFFMGPVAGCAVVFVKIVLKLIFQGTQTAFVGDLSNLIGSMCFILTASLIYRRKHTKGGAIAALSISTIIVSIVYVFLNAYIMLPMYSSLYGLPLETIIGMGHAVNPWVNDTLSLMIFAVLPFNLFKHGVTSILTYVLYKRVGNALRHTMGLAADPTLHRAGKAV
ncbi:MAG: ECF transporter S component [Peptococcaceae bacterium]|nr:ECF transporter S component [Peptococcaceae bacterium]